MNPKSMPRERLLGHMDLDTREWFDGVLTDAARKVVREPSEVSCWIICDGDVDPEWIESLNSVLDDNHLLTLPNGERISFGSNVNFLFETHDLKFASPATVSRMGMIFLSDEDLDVKRLVNRWLSLQPTDKQMQMSSWVDELFYKALKYVITFDQVVETTLVGTLINGLSQIKNSSSRQEFLVGIIRGLGGNLSIANRTTFAKEVFQWAAERPADLVKTFIVIIIYHSSSFKLSLFSQGSPLDCYAVGSAFLPYEQYGRTSDRETFAVADIGENSVVKTVIIIFLKSRFLHQLYYIVNTIFL
jgi:dynein heavy chain 2